MKAVVLAAGEGERLEPLTNRRPKPMLPVVNRPLLEYVVEAIADAGIDEIVLVVGYKRDRIQTHFGDGDDWGVSIEYAIQEKQLGTAHAVARAEPHVDGPFLVLNGDRILESELVSRLAERNSERAGALVAVTRSSRPSEYGVVTLENDRVADVVEKPQESPSELINAGVYGFDPGVFDAIRSTPANDAGEYAITTTLGELADPVRAIRYDGRWIDVSNLWDLVAINASVLDRRAASDGATVRETATISPTASVADGVYVGSDARIEPNATIKRGTTIGANATVGANAVLENAVVLADATIEDGAVLRDSVVAGNAHVGANATAAGGDADVVVGDAVHRDVTLGAVLGDNASVGAGCILEPGTVIGDDATIAPGTALSGRVPSGTEVRRG